MERDWKITKISRLASQPRVRQWTNDATRAAWLARETSVNSPPMQAPKLVWQEAPLKKASLWGHERSASSSHPREILQCLNDRTIVRKLRLTRARKFIDDYGLSWRLTLCFCQFSFRSASHCIRRDGRFRRFFASFGSPKRNSLRSILFFILTEEKKENERRRRRKRKEPFLVTSITFRRATTMELDDDSITRKSN